MLGVDVEMSSSAPLTALLDQNLQLQPFFAHVDAASPLPLPAAIGVTSMTAAPSIGGVAPASCGIITVPGEPTARTFFTQGGKFSDWLACTIRPVLPNTGNAELSYQLTVDDQTAEVAQAIETDMLFVITGADGKIYEYNGSLQWNNAKGGSIQINDWTDSGIVIPVIDADVPHRVVIQYAFDTVKHTLTVPNYSIDGNVYPIPAAVGVIPAKPSNWKLGAYLQVQQDLNDKGGGFAITLDDAQLAWW
jgi:hypothetical protein